MGGGGAESGAAREEVVIGSPPTSRKFFNKHPRSKLPTCLEFKAFLFENGLGQRSELCKRSYQRADTSPEFQVLAADLASPADLGFAYCSQLQ